MQYVQQMPSFSALICVRRLMFHSWKVITFLFYACFLILTVHTVFPYTVSEYRNFTSEVCIMFFVEVVTFLSQNTYMHKMYIHAYAI